MTLIKIILHRRKTQKELTHAKANAIQVSWKFRKLRNDPHYDPETDRIKALEKRVATLELLLNDVMHQLDKPDQHPKAKQNGTPVRNGKPKGNPAVQKSKTATPKPKKAPPSEIITALLKKKPHSRAEMEAATGRDTEAVTKCVSWMKKQELIEKTTDKDGDGNSRWKLRQ